VPALIVTLPAIVYIWSSGSYSAGAAIAYTILGMFVGATLLALGYQIFMGWVATNPDLTPAEPKCDSPETS
jgi:hypothetical protein